jgi:hypothetical protein
MIFGDEFESESMKAAVAEGDEIAILRRMRERLAAEFDEVELGVGADMSLTRLVRSIAMLSERLRELGADRDEVVDIVDDLAARRARRLEGAEREAQ